MGCPVGIGPEIILKFFQSRKFTGNRMPVVVGDLGVLRYAADTLGFSLDIIPWQPGEVIQQGTVPVFIYSQLAADGLGWGKPTIETGKAMAGYITEAVRLIGKGALAGMVTCPITKTALNKAGYPYPGHTEMLAELTGCEHFRMMMAGDRLKVVLVTIHEPLNRVSSMLSIEEITDCITMTIHSLQQDFGLADPRVAVAGFNPHGGEQGMFGHEEEQSITPAVLACAEKYRVSGPWPPDTVFYKAARGEFDAVVAMYHDQGLIPFKLLHFSDGVNVTLGLSIVRTSVDHGTAYDIAGQGKADASSLQAAWDMAVMIVDNREKEV